MRRSLVILSGLLNAVTKVVTGCLRMTKDVIFVVCLAEDLKFWDSSISIFQAVDAEKLSRRLRLSKAALSHIVELLFARTTTERANTVGIWITGIQIIEEFEWREFTCPLCRYPLFIGI